MNNIYNLNELTEEEKNKYNLNEITSTTEDKKEAPNYSSLMPGNTDYVNDNENNFNPGEALNKVGSFFTGLFSQNENESSIKSQYDSYQETKDIDTISGAAPDYEPVSSEPALEAEDIQNVNKKVGKVAGNVLNTVAGSGASFGAGVANSLDMLVDLSFQEDKQTIFEDYGESSQQFAKERFEAGAWEDNLDVIGSLKQGNIGEAVSKSVQGALQNSAQLLIITGMGILGGGAAAGAGAGQALSATSGYLSGLGAAATSQAPLALITASAAGSKYAGLEDREDLSINQKVSSGLLSGGLEAATETWGSLRYLDEISNSVPGVDKTIRSEVMRYARALIDPKKLAANGITEAKEEYITEFGDALFDSMLGISDKTLPEVLADQEPYLNSAAIGFTSGLGMSGAAQLSNINQVSQMNEDINNRQQKADQFMNYVEQSNFNLQEDTKQALWEEAINVYNPTLMYDWFKNAEQSIENNNLLTFEDGDTIINNMLGKKGNQEELDNVIDKIKGKQKTEQTEEVEEQTEETTNVSNPLEVSDEDVSLEEPAESNQYSDLNTEELLRVREGLLREFEVTQNPDAYQEARTIERILDEQGVEYGEQETTVEEPTTEENAAEQTEPQQIEQEDTQEVEEPTQEEEVVETQPQQSDVELTEEELMEPQGQNITQDNIQELSVEEIEDRIDDLFFELEEAETETEQIEIREQIDNLERELNTKVDEQQTAAQPAEETQQETPTITEENATFQTEQVNGTNYDVLSFDDGSELRVQRTDNGRYDIDTLQVKSSPELQQFMQEHGMIYQDENGDLAYNYNNIIGYMQDMNDELTTEQTTEDQNVEDTTEMDTTEDIETESTTESATEINFNSASREDLMSIDGIGSTTADRIIEFRNNNTFESAEDLLKVKGIGQNTLSKINNLNLNFETTETETTTTEEQDIEPEDTDIAEDEDVESEAEDLDLDDVASEVDDVEGSTQQISDELLSYEARDLYEQRNIDVRDYLNYEVFTSLEELQNLQDFEREDILDDIELEDPEIAEAIRSELEERAYETDDYYYKKTDNAKNKDDIRNKADASDTDGNYEGVNKATRRGIENTIRVDLGLPLRYGKLQSRDSEAQYDSIYKVVRTRDYSNMEVTAHEVGHHLSSMLDLDVEAFPELVQLLEDEGLKAAYDKSVWHEEGNSEFFKYYFNYPGQAKIKVPAYYDYVESVLQGSDLYEPVKQLQNQMNTWNKQSYADRVSGAMSRQDLDIAPLMTMKDKLNEALVDEDVVFKRALEQAGYDVETLETYKNPWKLKRLYSSVNDMVDVFLSKKSLDPQGRPNGKSLLEILSPVQDYIGETEGREFGDFEVYSLALHALEREAKFLARDLEARGNDKGKLAAKRLNAVIDNANIEALIQSLKMADNNPDNLRSLGLELPEGEYRFRATGININDIANTVNEYDSKLFRDTLKDLQEYQNNLVDYAQYYDMLSEDAAEDIKTAYNFHMPLHRYFGEELINEGQDTSRYTDLPDVVKSAYGSTRIIKDPIRTLVRDTSYVVRQANKNNIVVKFMEALDAKRDSGIGNLVGREITTPEPIDKENVVSYRVDGEIKARVVHPDIYRTLQGLNKESEHVLRTMLKPLEYSNNLFKKFAVINPKFWLNNLGRDEVRQMIYEDNNAIDKLKLFSTMADGMSEAFGLEKADTEAIFRGLGGARGGFAQYLKDMDNPQTLEELLRADKESKNPLDWLGDVAQWTEDTRRKGLFINKVGRDTDVMSMEAEEAERVLKEAAYFGKGEVLEDYSIKGRYTKEFDKYVAPFSAAGMTGGRHLYNKLKQPSTWVNGIINVTIPSLALWGMNRDKPEYQELPAWKKMLYFNWVKDNGEIISFPKPFITGYFFGAIPEMLAQVTYNKNGGELTDNLKTLIQAGAPNYQMAGGIAAGYEVLTNRADPLGDDYRIVPDSEKYLDNEDQYGEYNSEISKMLGSAINVSPRILDHLFEGQFTGTYSMVTNITDYVLGAKDFKEAGLGIVGVYSDPFITSTTVNKLYEDREKYNNLMSRLREKDMLKQEKGLNINEIREVATKYSKLNNITDTMSKYRKVSDIIDTLDIDPELKENTNKYIDIQNINFAREYYDREKIYLDSYMSQEEYQRVQELINWIQRNY
jgi:competence protein ComEA